MDTPQSLSSEELAGFAQALEIVGTNVSNPKERSVRNYDFAHPDKLAKTHMRVIHHLMSGLEKSWSNLLQSKLRTEAIVTIESLEQASFSAYVESLADPSLVVGVNLEGLKSNALFDMSAGVAMGIVDRLAGGRGQLTGNARPLTQIECSIIKQLLERLMDDLSAAWKPVVDLNAKLTAFHSSMDDIGMGENEMLVVCGFGWEFDSVKNRASLAIPISALDSIREKLSPDRWLDGAPSEPNTKINAEMPMMLSSVPISIEVELGKATLSMQDILDIAVGDVLKLDRTVNDLLDVKIDGEVAYRGRPGLIGSQQAIQITEQVDDDSVTGQVTRIQGAQLNDNSDLMQGV